jgi:hypothetical protein
LPTRSARATSSVGTTVSAARKRHDVRRYEKVEVRAIHGVPEDLDLSILADKTLALVGSGSFNCPCTFTPTVF